jgi:tetratricopeptide (TPR) repeat protein
VANVLNELASVALASGRFQEAERLFQRVADIYKASYGEHHYLYAVGLSNLASVYMARHEYVRAEQIYRDVIARFTAALSAHHLNTGVAEIKLGHALVGQKRFAEAEPYTLAGYRILTSQSSPSITWLQSARKDLALIYDAAKQPDKAAAIRAEYARIDASSR